MLDFCKAAQKGSTSAFLGSEHTAVREQVLCKASVTDRDELAREDRVEGVDLTVP